MNPFPLFLLSVILISLSGALSPGPLLFTNLSNASRWGWRGGFWLSIGHTFVEFPVILLIAFGLSFLFYLPGFHVGLAIAGGSVLIVFGALQVREATKSIEDVEEIDLAKDKPTRHPILIGFVFSALNPFFIVWWFTAGAKIVLDALLLAALAGVIIMFLSHVWIDYVWLIGTAWLTNKGTHLIGTKGYRVLNAIFGVLLILFGAVFYVNALVLFGIL
ncbi:MAG: LysE family transporter [Candidatus Hermodarchaeota archaeon]|nr:LysE family transporter [Candidatus Hermodarchaeota archaeon]